MKRIGFLLLVLCVSFVGVAGGQQSATRPPVGKLWRHMLVHPMASQMLLMPSITASANFNAQANPGHAAIVYDLGTYPGGSWAEGGGINDFGVAVAHGDVDSSGEDHLLRIGLFDLRAPKWSDLGSLGTYPGWAYGLWPDIANTGVITGRATSSDGHLHAFAWTIGSGKVDLGTLADLDSEYASYLDSNPYHVNKLATMIVGNSWIASDTNPSLPVVWTRDGPHGSWRIHKLDTKGWPNALAFGVNDFGQVSGWAWNDVGICVALLWNPNPNGRGWRTIQLPGSSEYPDVALATTINEAGEIAGAVYTLDWINGYASVYQPVDPQRTTYKLTLLPNPWNLPQGDTVEGINDLGDLVGASCDRDYNIYAVRWSTKDLTSVQLLGFPGDGSFACSVNNQRVALGFYFGGKCSGECLAAAKLR
jgi:probable HAF family extracellular repeat protein